MTADWARFLRDIFSGLMRTRTTLQAIAYMYFESSEFLEAPHLADRESTVLIAFRLVDLALAIAVHCEEDIPRLLAVLRVLRCSGHFFPRLEMCNVSPVLGC